GAGGRPVGRGRGARAGWHAGGPRGPGPRAARRARNEVPGPGGRLSRRGRPRGGRRELMRLNRLQLTNFRLHADTRIDFESGLTGVIGPNGSGKTTILEAIAWALYGMPAARGKRQDIRSLNAPGRAGVKVELDFDLAGHRHRVVRTLSSAELYIDSATSPIANSTSSVTDVLRRRLGMSQQEFFHT